MGERSGFLPGSLTPVVFLARLAGAGPQGLWLAANLFAALLSLLVILCTYVVGRGATGGNAGLWAAVLTAFGPEIVHLLPHLLATRSARSRS